MALAVGVHRRAPPPPPSPAPPAAEAGGWSPAPPAEGPLSGTFWATPPVPAAAFDVPEADRYAEGPLLGRGGMGEVRAVSDRRLQREVAEKSLLYPSVEGEARLEREARVTARLEHPGVVPIYDAGRDAQGRLCYRMRKVAGRSLYAAIRAAPDEAARLRLLRPLLDACRAVAYAHARGVVHRDLKPENILLGEFGEALVTDWGLAWDPADAPAHGSETPRLTAQGVVLGTPGYMSPEQAAGQPPRPQDDVWALGQSLLDLLGEAGPPELRAVASQAQAPLAARYADAGALAAELEAWFEGRRVAAYRYNTAELLRRGLARWRAATGVALISVALIVFGSLWSMQRLDAAAERARRAEAEANLARAAADRHLSAALAQQARDAALAGQRPEAEVLAAHALRLGAAAAEARGVLAMYAHVGRPARLASAALPAGCAPLALSASGASALLQCEGELRLIDGAGAPRWSRPLAAVSARFLSEEYVVVVDVGGHLIIAGRDGGLTVRTHVGEDLDGLYGDPAGQWAVAHNQRFRHRATADRAEALQPLPAPCLAALLLPTGELLSLLGDGTVEIGPPNGPPTERRALSAEVGPLGGARLLAADPAGQRIAIGTWDGELIVLDRAGGAPARRLAMGVGPAVDLAVSPEGDRVAFVGQQGRVRVYDGSAAQLLPALPAGGHGRVAFDGPDTLVLLGAALERWSLPHDSAPSRVEMGGGVTSARFVPSGDGLVAVGSFGRVARWSLADGRRAFSRDLSPDYVIKDLALLDGGRAIYVPSQFPGQPTVLEAETGAPRAAQPPPAQLQRRVAPFGGGLVGYGWGMGPVFFDPLSGRRDEGHQLAHALPLDLGAAPEGDVAALLLRNGDLMLISAADGGAPRLHSQDPAALAVDVARGGAVIALGRPDRLRLIVEGAERSVALPKGAALIDLALDPAGARVALGLRDGRALVYRVEDGVLEVILDAHTERVATVDWSPDGRLLATGSWDDTVRIWGVEPLGQVLAGGGPEARLAEARVAEARVAELEAAWGLQLEAALAEAR